MTNLHVNNLDLAFLKLPKQTPQKGKYININISCFHSGVMNHVCKEKTCL